MTTNKPMTGEQLDELMAVAVRMQRDAEVARDFPSANFAYAVQVAVLELRRTRDTTAALAAENASLKQFPEQIIGFIGKLGTSEIGSTTREAIESAAKRIKTPSTDAFLAEVRAQGVDDFCKMLGTYAKVEPERFNPQFADLYAKIVNRIFSEVMDNPEVYDLGTMSDWLERESEESRAYADMSINHHAKLRQDANTAELVAAGIITRVECVGGKCE